MVELLLFLLGSSRVLVVLCDVMYYFFCSVWCVLGWDVSIDRQIQLLCLFASPFYIPTSPKTPLSTLTRHTAKINNFNHFKYWS